MTPSSLPSIEWSLANALRLGQDLRYVLDIGAYQGDFALMVRRICPQSHVHMIEAQPNKRRILEAVCASAPDFLSYSMCLLSSQDGARVPFYEMETGSSVLEESSGIPRERVELVSRTVDSVAVELAWPVIDLLKLDVQGYELEVLKGAQATLPRAKAVLMEVSFIPLNRGAPLATDMFAFMADHGFLPYDICSLIRRPLDAALWQSDILFVRQDSSLRQNHSLGQ